MALLLRPKCSQSQRRLVHLACGVDSREIAEQSVAEHRRIGVTAQDEPARDRAGGIEPARWTRADQMGMGAYLKSRDWERYQLRTGNFREWRYRRKT
jgi:hypothetical protein